MGVGDVIYLAKDNNLTYRWSGTVYVLLSPSSVTSIFGRIGVVVSVGICVDNCSGEELCSGVLLEDGFWIISILAVGIFWVHPTRLIIKGMNINNFVNFEKVERYSGIKYLLTINEF